MTSRKRKPVRRAVGATAELADLDGLAGEALKEIFEAAGRTDLTNSEFRTLCRQILAKHRKVLPK